MPDLFNTHNRNMGQGAFWHVCRKCGNNHGLVRKYQCVARHPLAAERAQLASVRALD